MAFIRDLVRTLADREPDLLKKVQSAINFLETDFADTHDRLPSAFCHGDFHALNVIWGSAGIKAVIDWEFSGLKPDLYDAAIMIGCLGSENPAALAGPLALDFISRLKACGAISRLSLSVLVEFVIALRFAWLSEWLRHDDRAMIDLETTYINLLYHHSDDLKQIWQAHPEVKEGL
jgi:homoserine kinase type II